MKSQVLFASGLATTATAGPLLPLPSMGFNNWARFTTEINEAMFVDAAAAMSKNGMLKVGYNRLNLDDAWSTRSRLANGSMEVDREKFPKGLIWLAEHIKEEGFIPGIYTDAGTKSCGGYPGALGYEETDLKDFLDWGYEYLKMDGCYMPSTEAGYHEIYGHWNEILDSSKRPMVFSDSAPAYFCGLDNLTDWYTVMGWAQEYGDLARHSYDIANYDQKGAWNSLLTNYGQHVRLARYQRPGFFNDPDFLNTDHPEYTMDEKKTHFALWCSFSAPLIISANIPELPKEEVEFLTNEDLIAVDQDPLIQQATLVSQDGTFDVLTKNMANYDRILTILNRGDEAADLTVSWAKIGIQTARVNPDTELSVKDLWTGETTKVKVGAEGVTAKAIPFHGTAVYRISGGMAGSAHPIVLPTGMIFNTFSLKCLTDDKSGTVTWAECNGDDSQTWVVRNDGHINSLLRPNECIVDANGRILSRHSGCESDSWQYFNGGNLVNGNTGHCLTENGDGSASADDCGYETNEQVVALPVGADVTEVHYYKPQ